MTGATITTESAAIAVGGAAGVGEAGGVTADGGGSGGAGVGGVAGGAATVAADGLASARPATAEREHERSQGRGWSCGSVRGHALALATVTVWGVTFVCTKVLLTALNPIEILFLRFALGFMALCVIHHRVTPFMGWRTEVLFAGAGATGVAAYFLMENIALTMTSASNVGIIVTVAPLFIALIAVLFTREEKVAPQFFIGFAVAFFGIALISYEGAGTGEAGLAGCVLAVAAALAWAVYSTIGKKLGKLGLSVVATTKRTFLWGLAFMLPLLPVLGFGSGAAGEGMGGLLNPVMIANLLFLGLVASATCYVMWNKAASILGVVSTSAYIYLSPIITVACSVAVLGEPLTWQIALGIALTIAGLALSER